MLAVSDKISEGYEVLDGFVDQTDDAVEGSGTFQLIGTDQYMLMYDLYTAGKYQFCVSDDLKAFKVIDEDISMNFHPRHGSVIPITQAEMDRLLDKWGGLSVLLHGSKNAKVKTNNIEIGESSIVLPVEPASDLSQFDPMFQVFPGVEISPSGKQDFSRGPVSYTLTMNEESRTVDVSVQKASNPVLDGFYADPEIIFSEREQKYYLYHLERIWFSRLK